MRTAVDETALDVPAPAAAVETEGTDGSAADAPAPPAGPAPSDPAPADEPHPDEIEHHALPTPSVADRTESEKLLQRLAETPEGDPSRAALRDAVVTSHLPLVHHIARRFHGRGEPHDDVVQVGTIGLIKAVDRFEPGRGVPFAGYAVPTVTGEIRRYFRDRAGSVRLPRRVQEFQVAVTQARETLTHQLGRTPTVEEVAHLAGLDTDTVLEVLESAYSLSTVPLDVDNGVSESLGEEDVALDEVLTRATLRPVLAKLAPRERRIIALRFVRGMSQAQIAEEVGLSQMHVSRLLSKTLARLRAEMSKPDPSA
ncbi:SigB/SigF/SigG family RNA polymerase sigma factor [Aquipuribacter hungaricus]|uniref:SigB/SigF/SigG family RNA polymerase sigma factor n=2 Tax=Aquipuribacter hungaricus TaxID=545624 RepID=A0ABV7WH30_9MICO